MTGRKRPADSSMAHLPSGPAGAHWPDTPWSRLLKWNELNAQDRKAVLDRLVLLYYKPVYRFFQRVLGLHGDDLTNLTQDFFTRLIDKDFLKNLRYEKNFRAFLKVACRRHYINWLEARRDPAHPLGDRDVAEKTDVLVDEELRGGYLEEAKERVRRQLLAEGKTAYVQVFEARLGPDAPDYAAIAARVGKRVYDVRNYLSKARALFREALLALAAERADDPEQELRELGLLDFLKGS